MRDPLAFEAPEHFLDEALPLLELDHPRCVARAELDEPDLEPRLVDVEPGRLTVERDAVLLTQPPEELAGVFDSGEFSIPVAHSFSSCLCLVWTESYHRSTMMPRSVRYFSVSAGERYAFAGSTR